MAYYDMHDMMDGSFSGGKRIRGKKREKKKLAVAFQ